VRSDPARPTAGPPLLRVERLSQTIPFAAENLLPVTALRDISFSLEAGEQVAVVGAPGSGKTTLLRAVALLQRPEAGRIFFEGQDITRAWGGQLRALRQRLQFVGGDPLRSLPPSAGVSESLLEPLRIHRHGSGREQTARVEAMAAQVGPNPLLLGRKVSALSAGMRQRVLLARALTLKPRLLICDGLTERLEPALTQPLFETLARLCRAEAVAWLWATADPALARQFAGRVLRLENGRLHPG
jgi:ABC-type glutathione transport system ATPase component